MRPDQRKSNQLRPVTLESNVMPYAEGSVKIEMGNTCVLCSATVTNEVPRFLMNANQGWITAEYAMLPRATQDRTRRERKGPSGRTQEIQRLIGRSLRSAFDLQALGERTILVDCDVLQADGGTRCASITGAYLAVIEALRAIKDEMVGDFKPVREFVSAISVGYLNGELCLDLCYEEDSNAVVDMNVVGTSSGRIIEVQMTAEEHPIAEPVFQGLLKLGLNGVKALCDIQLDHLGDLESIF